MNIKKYGAFMITKTALERYSTPNYWYRDDSISQIDNGWRIIGFEDSDEFLADPENWTIINVNDAIEICPFVKDFYNAEVGTELFVDFDENQIVSGITNLVNEEKIDLQKIDRYFSN